MAITRKSRGRQKFLVLAPVSKNDVPGGVDRDAWIDSVCNSFVTPGEANRAYYRVFLEELWPPNHGIPGPHLTEEQLREYAFVINTSPHDLLNQIVEDFFNN